jgi:RNA polymerase sigma-70 factor (ECF subfamily)
MSANSDEKLIAAYLRGEEKALEILIKRYLKLIYSFAFRFVSSSQEAEDITQEVFIKAWRNLKKFDPRRSRFATLQGRQNKKFKSWLFSIAKNTCLDAIKKKRTIPFSEFEQEGGKNILIERLADQGLLLDELYQRADMMNKLNLAVAKLPAEYSLVEQLHCIEELTFKEISQILNKPLNTLKSQHRRALVRLKKILQKN